MVPGMPEKEVNVVALMVILTIAGFIAIDGCVQYAQAKRQADAAEAVGDRAPVAPVDVTVPGGVFLSPQHSWLQIREDGRVRIGLDALVAGLIGRISAVSLPSPGHSLQAGQPVFSVWMGERNVDVVAPVSGTIKAVNVHLIDRPDTLFHRPYTNWICEMEAADLGNDVKSLRIGSQALSWLKAEAERMADFLMRHASREPALGTVMADGGTPSSGALEALDRSTWREFQQRFLVPKNSQDA
jgi:glycine cleavage system H lipoate-binding protein